MLELAVLLAPIGRELIAFHTYSESNTVADALSRMAEGAVLPAELVQVSRVTPKIGAWRFLQENRVRMSVTRPSTV